MAWGCFCWIPCPYKKWNEDDRAAMLGMLPLVGTGLGLVTALIGAAVCALTSQPLLAGAVITACYFVMTGFIHLDGFMDVCDAVMPRHPSLTERRRILKDPHTGSFAAVSMALMLLVFAGSAAVLSQAWTVSALIVIAVTTVSRCCSAVTVLREKPMETSQYANADFASGGGLAKGLPAIIVTVLVLACCVGMCFLIPQISWVTPGTMPWQLAAAGVAASWRLLAAAAVCALTALIMGAINRKALGGMNGDISGHMITSGEMAGLLAAALLMG